MWQRKVMSTFSLHSFLVDDWFKTLVDKPAKKEDMTVKDDQEDKEGI